MQEVSELDVVTLLVRYKTLFIKQCVFLHVEREERSFGSVDFLEINFLERFTELREAFHLLDFQLSIV